MPPFTVSLFGFRYTYTEHHFTNPRSLVVSTTSSYIPVRVMVFQVPGTTFFIEDFVCADPKFNEVIPSAGSGIASIEAYYEEEAFGASKQDLVPLGSFLYSLSNLLIILDRTIERLDENLAREREEYSQDFEDPVEREHFFETFLHEEIAMRQAILNWRIRLIQEKEAFDRHHAATIIQRAYREATGNPAHPMCQRRLQREFHQFPF